MYVERIKLNLDSIAMMLFCARLKAYKEVPLSNEEWLLIERIIKKKGLKGPASLLSMNQTELEEILEINENLKHYINNWTNSCNIASIAIGNEMITFEDSARYLIENHITTQEECGLLEGI